MGYQPPAKRTFWRDGNYAVVLVLLNTAYRIGEAFALRMGDVDLAARSAVFRVTKGKKPRTVPLSPECADALEPWLRIRAWSGRSPASGPR